MYRNIVVPLDGSSFGEEAVSYAVGLALRGAGTVELVTVPDVPDLLPSEPSGGNATGRDGGAAEEAARTYLEALRERIPRKAGRPALAVSVLAPGEVPRRLARHLESGGADLVVMTSHGHGPLKRLWLGSTTDALVRESPCPVLVVRPADGEASPGQGIGRRFRHVLVPLDGSEGAERALSHARALAGDGGRITLFRAVSPYVPGAYPYLPRVEGQYEKREKEEAAARRYLEERAEALREEGFTVDGAQPTALHPAVAILEYVEGEGVEAVAMWTGGRAARLRPLLGSVTDKVLRGAPCPVLVVRGNAPTGAGREPAGSPHTRGG